MKIGFFGGCFNPPTNVHIDIANDLVKNKIVDKVIFIPIGDFYQKKELVSFKNRYEMISLAIKNYKELEIDNFEKNIKQTMYATDAFKIISKKYSNHNLYFIMGSDNYNKMNLWKEYDEIIDRYNYIIVKRDNETIYEHKNNILLFTPQKQYNYDSTIVRQLIKDGKSIENFVNHDVAEYIKKNNLYI